MIENPDSIKDLLEELSDNLDITEPKSDFIKSSINPEIRRNLSIRDLS